MRSTCLWVPRWDHCQWGRRLVQILIQSAWSSRWVPWLSNHAQFWSMNISYITRKDIPATDPRTRYPAVKSWSATWPAMKPLTPVTYEVQQKYHHMKSLSIILIISRTKMSPFDILIERLFSCDIWKFTVTTAFILVRELLCLSHRQARSLAR